MLQSFLTVGQQILTLYLLLVVGFVLGKVKLLDDRASVALSSLVMYVVSPCMMVVAFQRPLEHTALHNFGVVTGVSAVLHVVFIAAAMLLIRDRDRERQNCLRFAAVFSNCGFMGYPLMAALLGSIGVFYGSAYVIVFTILSWTWGVYVITGDRSQLRLKPLLLNPGVISVVLAMALYLGQVTMPEPLMVPINYLADLNTPLPMLVVGYQLSHANFKAALQGISSWVTLVLRLLVLPLASLGICLALNVSHDLTLVLLIAAGCVACTLPFVRSRIGFLFTSDFAEANTSGGRAGRKLVAMTLLEQRGKATGVGLGMFGGAVAMQNQVIDHQAYFYVDNYYLKLMIEMGYTGLAAFLITVLSFLVNGCRALYRTAQLKKQGLSRLFPLCAGCFAGLCGVLVHCGFENIFEEPYMMAYFWTIAAMLIWAGFLQNPRKEDA